MVTDELSVTIHGKVTVRESTGWRTSLLGCRCGVLEQVTDLLLMTLKLTKHVYALDVILLILRLLRWGWSWEISAHGYAKLQISSNNESS